MIFDQAKSLKSHLKIAWLALWMTINPVYA